MLYMFRMINSYSLFRRNGQNETVASEQVASDERTQERTTEEKKIEDEMEPVISIVSVVFQAKYNVSCISVEPLLNGPLLVFPYFFHVVYLRPSSLVYPLLTYYFVWTSGSSHHISPVSLVNSLYQSISHPPSFYYPTLTHILCIIYLIK